MQEGRVVTLVSVSGVPGVGKSSALKRLRKSGLLSRELAARTSAVPHLVFVKEPVKLWRERGYLAQFYENPSLNALPFQLIVFDTHVDAVEAALARVPAGEKNVLLIVERSMFDELLFWKQQVDLKQVTANPLCDAAYMRIWSKWNRFVPKVSHIFFFSTTHLQETMRRLKDRGRAEELNVSVSQLATTTPEGEVINEVGGITLEYQEKLLAKHAAWFTEPTAHPLEAPIEGIPCTIINADSPYHENDGSLLELAKMMVDKLIQYY